MIEGPEIAIVGGGIGGGALATGEEVPEYCGIGSLSRSTCAV
jgi:hypothetical protein